MSAMTIGKKYVLVRHSAYVANNDPQFRGGLETEMVGEKRGVELREKGYAVYDTYNAASKAEMELMYPDPMYKGLAPIADTVGTFGPAKVKGAAVFKINVERRAK